MSRFVVSADWSDVPHLSEQAKADLFDSIPPFQREARMKGVPQLGAGAIYPIPLSDISVDPFAIPALWRRAYGFDVGWNWTAGIWGAWNEQTDTIYLYDAYKRGQAEPDVHAAAVKRRGEWIKGVCDPAAQGTQINGHRVIELYRTCGLDLDMADNSLDAGLYEVWNRLATGRLKVFKTLTEWCAEYTMYHRNERGQIVKEHDHLLDATRYLVMSGGKRATVKVAEPPKVEQYEYVSPQTDGLGWLSV